MYSITQKQYNYLLPIYGLSGMIPRKIKRFENGKCYFFGSYEEYQDAMNRCKYLD